MDKHKSLVLIDYDKCVPCSGLVCVGVCPQGILEIGPNKKPQIIDVASCTQCDVCANMCPSKAIIITRSEQPKDR
jgi:NAD-dependent dihydropyrimidine dehydrogenase PreA subunit